MAINIKLPLGPFQDALFTVLGAVCSFAIVSMVAASLPLLFTDWYHMTLFELFICFSTAWLLHWGIACLPLWGLIFAVLQVISFHALIYSSRHSLFILGLIFANQLFISTTVISTVSYHSFGPLATGGFFLVLTAFGLWQLHIRGYSRATM